MSLASSAPSERSLHRHTIVILGVVLSLVGGVGGWAATTSLSSAVIANGVVIVDDNVKKIQHLNGGIVRELLVKEGDRVAAGQTLVRLNPTTVKSELAIVQSSLAQLYARRARLQAQRDGATSFETPKQIAQLSEANTADDLVNGERKLFESQLVAQDGMKSQLQSRKQQLVDEANGISVQLKSINETIKLTDDELNTTQTLYDKHLVSIQRLLAIKRSLAEQQGTLGQRLADRAQTLGKINETDMQILQLDQDSRKKANDDLADTDAKIAEYEQRELSAKDQMSRLDIISPIAGRVYQLAVHTVNGVVNPGETLMLVVPDSRDLTVEARISPSDIDQVHLHQTARIRFSAFDQKVTPEIMGEVVTIAPDLVNDERTGASYYPLRVRPQSEELKELKGRQLYPGMPAEVFLTIADRTVLTYFTKPISDRMNHVFREE